jgi:hypothetical protein
MLAPDVLLVAESNTVPIPQRSPFTPVGVAGMVLTVAVTFLPELVQPFNEAVVVYVVVLLTLGE